MEIKLRFLGAAQNVTGSRHLLEANGSRILIDCGIYQERHFQHRNWDPFPVPPSSIDAVLITHAHLDHCGWLPRLVQGGFKGRVYCTAATAEIARIVLLDSAKIQMEDIEHKKKRHQRENRKGKYPLVPLYTIENVENTMTLFSPVRYEKPVKIADGIEAAFYDAGHILGASMIKTKIHNNGQTRSVLFSGDVGRRHKPILRDPTVFDKADYVLIESTYGDRLHERPEDTKQMLKDTINATKKAGGNIVIPSFSIERAQDILYYLNELLIEDQIPDMQVFLDSPMALKVTEVFEKHPELYDREMVELIRQHESPFDFPGLQMVETTSQSKTINRIKGTVLIIAGSGMCTGGRIKHHLVNNISNPQSSILFAGYQANGTLGRLIVDGADPVRIMGQFYPVRARVVRVHGFSGHADRDGLFRWLSNIKQPPKTIFLVHGETDSTTSFAEYLKQKTNWNVQIPNYLDQIILH